MACLGARATAWRIANYPKSSDAVTILAKATEELGEVARALIGTIEDRPDRGDVVQEIAQTIIVLASLAWGPRPG